MLFVSRLQWSGAATSWRSGFQSRNRDAFRFKGPLKDFFGMVIKASFNLGIEMLFVFKRHCKSWLKSDLTRFNLGIEMLFVSREHRSPAPQCRQHSFNLGIEMLFVSSSCRAVGYYKSNLKVSISESRCFFVSSTSATVKKKPRLTFQSRNRDAFRFKWRSINNTDRSC